MILIGYSGHAYVVAGILRSAGITVTGYCDKEEKKYNPLNLVYHGSESSQAGKEALEQQDFFIAIGDNQLRRRISLALEEDGMHPVNAIHNKSIIDPSAVIGSYAVMIAAGVIINPLATIGNGAVCNTGCIIEHECIVGDFTHIGPGAVLCGNVKIGEETFVGANAVIRQGITVGKNAVIGAGAVVVKNVADGATVVGVPAK